MSEPDPVNEALGTARLIWLLGPPGAGKTTLAKQQQPRFPSLRLIDIGDLLAPLVLESGRRPGMKRAKVHIFEALRELAHAPKAPERFLVTSTDAEQEVFFPLRDGEAVLLLLPLYDQWLRQLRERPPRPAPSASMEEAHNDYHRFASWVNLPLVRIVATGHTFPQH